MAYFQQKDKDYDLLGDACDTNKDTDKDGVDDSVDNCPSIVNPDQRDTDKDGKGEFELRAWLIGGVSLHIGMLT